MKRETSGAKVATYATRKHGETEVSERNQLITDLAVVVIASGVTTLPFPPTSVGLVDGWNNSNVGSIPEFDVEIWADSTVNLTAAELLGGVLQPLVYADNDITTVDHTVDSFTKVAHGLLTGDGPLLPTNSGGALPAGLTAGTTYWAIKSTADVFFLAASLEDALAGTKVALTGNGTGTHTITDTADTERIHWNSHGLLGQAADGAVALTNQLSYIVRCRHHSRTFAYAVRATLSAANATYVNIYPVVEM